ncbi:MAG: hypothetical protein LBN00_01225 [Oscillospiraceae bacterium]|jgi:hypothetical protein|nr:hypothetical protein [Oscillospiraceae bacterium]
MTKKEKGALIKLALNLAAVGKDVEKSRARLRRLAENGVDYSAPEMAAELDRFMAADRKWKAMEAEYLSFRDKFTP